MKTKKYTVHEAKEETTIESKGRRKERKNVVPKLLLKEGTDITCNQC